MELWFISGKFIDKRRPHLQDRIRETEFENVARNGWIDSLVTKILLVPSLRLARLVGHSSKRFGTARREFDAVLGSVDVEIPGIGIPR